ncbi:hypothetical protein D3C80_1413470 [compost metagenome]
MGFTIGNVGNRAYHHEWRAELMANVANGGGFHLNGGNGWEGIADAGQRLCTVNEGVTAANQAAYRVQVKLFDAVFR